MRYVPLILLSSLLSVGSLQAQLPDEGYYVAASGSSELFGVDVGYWVPQLGLPISGMGNSLIAEKLSLRWGLELVRDRRSHQFEGRLHGDVGLSGERFYFLVGLLVVSGNSDRSAGVGARVSPGFHFSDHLSAEAYWETATAHPPAVGGRVIVTF